MKNTEAPIGDFDGWICPLAKFSGMRQALSVLWGRGGTSSLWGVWHQDEALWRGPMPYEGGDGQRLLWRRRLRSLCSTLEWRSQVDGLIGPEPLLQVSVRGLMWRRCVPPIPE